MQASSPLADRIVHWYDLTCPFCYIAQERNVRLTAAGHLIEELPYRAHPEIPPEGLLLGVRSGPMYDAIEREAVAAGLPLLWPDRLPNSGRALSAAEWVRRREPGRSDAFRRSLFAAHFAEGRDLGDSQVVLTRARAAGIDAVALDAALASGSALAAVEESEARGRRIGVEGTPAWLIRGSLVSGLQSAFVLERLAAGESTHPYRSPARAIPSERTGVL